jgi:hypothetical protein
LEREIDRVRHELEITAKRTVQLEQRVKDFSLFFRRISSHENFSLKIPMK